MKTIVKFLIIYLIFFSVHVYISANKSVEVGSLLTDRAESSSASLLTSQ